MGDEWLVVVTSGSTMLTDQAYGLIEARDRADRIVEKLGKPDGFTVVHLLEGDAFAFTTAYLHARHGLTAPSESTTDEETADDGVATQEFSFADLDDEEES